MPAPTTAFDMKSIDFQGVIHEDVMNEIFNIDPIALPYQDMAGRESSDNQYKSWVTEDLVAIKTDNRVLEGVDAGTPITVVQARIGNHHQISEKVVSVSDRSNEVNTIGYANRLAHELMIAQKSLKRDMEAMLLSNQASVEMKTTSTTAVGAAAGCSNMIAAGNRQGVTSGGAFSGGIFSAIVPVASRGLTEKMIRDADEAAYNAGGNPSVLMSTPKMIRGISEYMFTASARIATLMSDANVRKGKYGNQGATAIGAVQVFTSDFGTYELVPNQQQQNYDNGGTPNVTVFLFEPRYWAVSYLQPITVKPLGATGSFERRHMTVDYTNMCLAPKSSACIMAINPATAVVAA